MSETQPATTRITVDELAESVASGVLRAVERRVDLGRHLAEGKSLLVAPWITVGGRVVLTNLPTVEDQGTEIRG